MSQYVGKAGSAYRLHPPITWRPRRSLRRVAAATAAADDDDDDDSPAGTAQQHLTSCLEPPRSGSGSRP